MSGKIGIDCEQRKNRWMMGPSKENTGYGRESEGDN